MMKLMGYIPVDKVDGLREFRDRGYVIVDASYRPVNDLGEGKSRDDRILGEYPSLLHDLKALNPDKTIPLILVKANICKLLELPLRNDGFVVANSGILIPFPASGQQNRFRERMAMIWRS